MTDLTRTEELEYRLKSMTFQRDLLILAARKIRQRAWENGNFSPHKTDDLYALSTRSRDAHYETYAEINALIEKYEDVLLTADENGTLVRPQAKPGSFRDARGITGWQPGDEPAEVSIRRSRGHDDDDTDYDALYRDVPSIYP